MELVVSRRDCLESRGWSGGPVVSRYARLVGDIVFGSARRAGPPAEAALQQQTEGEGQRNGAVRGCERDAGEKVVGSGGGRATCCVVSDATR